MVQKNEEKKPRIIIHTDEETKKLEKKNKEEIFWKRLLYDGLGGKKGHDN